MSQKLYCLSEFKSTQITKTYLDNFALLNARVSHIHIDVI